MSDDSKITVTLKGDGAAPWIVVRGDTPADVNGLLNTIDADGLVGTAVITAASLSAVFTANAQVGAVPVQVETIPQAAPPTTSAPQASAPPAQAAPAPSAGRKQTDNWQRTYTDGLPTAPMTPFGQAVLKEAKAKASGKPYQQWIDPRSKEIPWNWAAGVRNDPADKWEGEFAR